jgi:hypothetical protein
MEFNFMSIATSYISSSGYILGVYAISQGLLHAIVYYLLIQYGSTKWDTKMRLNLSNRFIAFWHAVIMFSRTAYYWMYVNPTYAIGSTMCPFQCTTNDLMVGYLMYDTISEVYVMNNFEPLMLGHHVIGAVSHIACRVMNSGVCAYYHMMVYVAEASTPWLHLSWVLHACDLKHTAVFKATFLLVLVVFTLSRLVWGPFMQYDLYARRGYWYMSTDTGGDWLYLPNVLCVLFFNCINYTWGKTLFEVAIKASRGEVMNGDGEEEKKKNRANKRRKKKD